MVDPKQTSNPLLLETIRISNGRVYNIRYHNARYNESRKKFFGIKSKIDLRKHIDIPPSCQKGLYKCRILYGPEIEKIEILPQHHTPIQSLKLVFDDNIDYEHKYANREALKKLYEKRGKADDILIVKSGFISDSYYANAAFLKDNRWFTPEKPLLKGTRRQMLIDKGRIVPANITKENLRAFTQCTLFNALIPLGKIIIPVSDIY